MIEASLIWTDKDRFVGQARSAHAMVIDAGAEKTANSPMELVLLALCGCTSSDVVGILRKKREPFTGLEVRVEGEREVGYPAVYISIHLTYRVPEEVSKKSVEDAVRLSREKFGRLSAMLERTAKITEPIEHVSW